MEIDIVFDSFNKLFNNGTNITGSINIGCSERVIDFQSLNLILTVK
jgi:hypothetical protein